MTKTTIADALDRATAHLVRADYQFHIQGPHQKDHFQRARYHLKEARAAFEDASGVLDALYAALYGGQ